MTTVCRFCQVPIEIPLPDDDRMQRLMRVLSTRACCNRCAGYQRSQRDRAESLGKLGLVYKYAEGDNDKRAALLKASKVVMQTMIQAAEEHHFVSGLSAGLEDWVGTFCQTPNAGEWQAKLFVKGAADIAKRTHKPPVEANFEY